MARFLITLLGSSKQNCDWHISLYGINIVRLKELHEIYLSQSQEIVSQLITSVMLFSFAGRVWSSEVWWPVESALSHITNNTLSDSQWLQTSLPIRFGGLAISRVTSLALTAYQTSVTQRDSWWSSAAVRWVDGVVDAVWCLYMPRPLSTVGVQAVVMGPTKSFGRFRRSRGGSHLSWKRVLGMASSSGNAALIDAFFYTLKKYDNDDDVMMTMMRKLILMLQFLTKKIATSRKTRHKCQTQVASLSQMVQYSLYWVKTQ